MTDRPHGAPDTRPPAFDDLRASLRAGLRDFLSAPLPGLFFASVYVLGGIIMAAITYATGTTYWLILAVLGFPLVGAFAALGLYEISRRRQAGIPLRLGEVMGVVWAEKNGQLPWLAVMVVVLFLFWFFLGHMIFALFLGLSPMTNVSTSFDVFLSADGLTMLAFGSVVGAIFASLTFAMSVLGMPMLLGPGCHPRRPRGIIFRKADVSSALAYCAAIRPMLSSLRITWWAQLSTSTFSVSTLSSGSAGSS